VLSVRRRLLSVDLLKAKHIGREVLQDRSQNLDPMLEFIFVPTRHIEIFEIECRKADRMPHRATVPQPLLQIKWSGSGLSAFLGAGLTGFAAGFAFSDLGPFLAFLLAILADHLDHFGKMAGMLGID
jgi:hypothetical protein